jgi:DNA-binding NarL/FixJ family response regulator
MIQVVTIDEYEIFRIGLRAILNTATDIEVSAEASTVQEARTIIAGNRVDVLVTGLSSAGCAGMELLRRLKEEHPTLRVVVVITHSSADYVRIAIMAGAAGYLTKECTCAQVIAAVRKVAGGGIHLDQTCSDGLLSELYDGCEPIGHQSLSKRELDVFLRIANGQTCTKIASDLSRSVKTISSHKARIMDKMHLKSTAQLVQYAVAHSLVAAKYRR